MDHDYAVSVHWQGNTGSGTSGYRDYKRDLELQTAGCAPIAGSSDTPFRGDGARWNPEELLLGALAQCHMLSYLHVAVMNGVIVTGYADDAIGTMAQEGNGGHFTSATLRPRVTVARPEMVEVANGLHALASELCFIAASVNFPVLHEPTTSVDSATD